MDPLTGLMLALGVWIILSEVVLPNVASLRAELAGQGRTPFEGECRPRLPQPTYCTT
jgi:hypothetical protein